MKFWFANREYKRDPKIMVPIIIPYIYHFSHQLCESQVTKPGISQHFVGIQEENYVDPTYRVGGGVG